MANEITLTASLQFAKGGVAAAPLAVNGLQVNMAGTKYVRGVESIAITETVVGIGNCTTLGYAIFHNLDATNFVTIRMATGITTGMKLKPGEYCMVRLGGNAPCAIADTAPCLVDYMIIED